MYLQYLNKQPGLALRAVAPPEFVKNEHMKVAKFSALYTSQF
jgi:hypothetical protein